MYDRQKRVVYIGGGRKGKYEYWLTDDGLLLLQKWARDGLTDEQIAKKCRINTATMYDWKKKYSEISEALKKGKEIADTEVENALFKRAIGFRCVDVREELEAGMLTKEIKTIKFIPPDVTAGIFWLKNRTPDIWRDRAKDSSRSAALDAAEQQARIDKLQAETEFARKRFEMDHERHAAEMAMLRLGATEAGAEDNFTDMLKVAATEVWIHAAEDEPDRPDDF
jgi:hypothetical protein